MFDNEKSKIRPIADLLEGLNLIAKETLGDVSLLGGLANESNQEQWDARGKEHFEQERVSMISASWGYNAHDHFFFFFLRWKKVTHQLSLTKKNFSSV